MAKRKRSPYDQEVLVLGRVLREIQALADHDARARIAHYVSQRFDYVFEAAKRPPASPFGDVVPFDPGTVPNLSDPAGTVPNLSDPVDARHSVPPSPLVCNHGIELGSPCEKCQAEAGQIILEEKPEVCVHQIPMTEKCFGCEAEFAGAKSAPEIVGRRIS